jgi:Prokaryotic E2 family B
MRDDSPLVTLSQVMKSRGFDYVARTSDDWLEFQGSCFVAESRLATYIEVDPFGLQYPRIRVDLPKGSPEVLAHVGANGQICYAAKGSLVLDIFDIAGQTNACLDLAIDVLNRTLHGEMNQDLEDEFFAFWPGDICFLDIYPGDPGGLEFLFD